MMLTVLTKPCPVCHDTSIVEVDEKAYQSWRDGALIQVAFPGMSTELREQLISGFHPKCWTELFGEDPDFDAEMEEG
jgi:hypothetical protein